MANMHAVLESLKHFKTTAYIIQKYISNILEPKKAFKINDFEGFYLFCAEEGTRTPTPRGARS